VRLVWLTGHFVQHDRFQKSLVCDWERHIQVCWAHRAASLSNIKLDTGESAAPESIRLCSGGVNRRVPFLSEGGGSSRRTLRHRSASSSSLIDWQLLERRLLFGLLARTRRLLFIGSRLNAALHLARRIRYFISAS